MSTEIILNRLEELREIKTIDTEDTEDKVCHLVSELLLDSYESGAEFHKADFLINSGLYDCLKETIENIDFGLSKILDHFDQNQLVTAQIYRSGLQFLAEFCYLSSLVTEYLLCDTSTVSCTISKANIVFLQPTISKAKFLQILSEQKAIETIILLNSLKFLPTKNDNLTKLNKVTKTHKSPTDETKIYSYSDECSLWPDKNSELGLTALVQQLELAQVNKNQQSPTDKTKNNSYSEEYNLLLNQTSVCELTELIQRWKKSPFDPFSVRDDPPDISLIPKSHYWWYPVKNFASAIN